MERIFFRGFVFGGLRGRFGPVPAAVASSLLLGLLHAGNPGAIYVIVPMCMVGVLFAGATGTPASSCRPWRRVSSSTSWGCSSAWPFHDRIRPYRGHFVERYEGDYAPGRPLSRWTRGPGCRRPVRRSARWERTVAVQGSAHSKRWRNGRAIELLASSDGLSSQQRLRGG